MRFTLILASLAACAATASAGQLIAVDSSRVLYSINPATGAKTNIGTVSSNAGTTGGLARNSTTGTIYLTSTGNDSLYTLDISTGTATLVGSYGSTTVVMHGIEWDSTQNKLWGGSNGNLFDINPATGAAVQVGVSGLTSFTNLGYVPGADALYATNSGTDSFYSVDRATGAMTLIAALGSGSTNPNGLAYDTDNGVLYMVDNSADNLYTIDPATGLATLVGSTGSGNLLGLVYIPDPTPPHLAFCFGDGTGTACPCGNNGTAGNGCANSIVAAGGHLAASGTASIAADTMLLSGSGMPNSSALYFQGTQQLAGGLGAPFGDGLRCAGGSVIRLGTKFNVAGASQFPEVGDPLLSVRGQVLVPGIRTYQVWYRNAAVFCTTDTFNLTNGVQVTWVP